MKYVCIDDGAVSELISGREYQSIDFEAGDKLISGLSGKVELIAKLKDIVLLQDLDGAFLTTKGSWKQKKYVVIDCETSSLFTQLREGESLTSFQKLLRFCSKYWSGSVLNNHEKLISQSSKAIIFPLPISTKSSFRIAVEREPMRERLKKRELDGKFLLVYKSGWESKDSITEKADETNFRKAFERLPDVYKQTSKAIKNIQRDKSEKQLASTQLESPPKSRPMYFPMGDWMLRATNQQRNFILADRDIPHRLEGPAGTGKTLSLMLRTVWILSQAERAAENCHALLVTHSEATRESICNALSVIDPNNYQSRNRDTEAISMSVETLASLCAKYLKQSISDTEFVDRDAQDSKLLQQLYIEQAITEMKELDFESFKHHLSSEFRTQLETMPGSELASMFQHEISVLLKGRAGDAFDVYKNCPSLKYGLPISNDADKGYSFGVFKKYQAQLENSSQFDTDDVVISAIGQLDTPIWRRRRARDGFDFIAIDETHLFNINELHVFHHFTRSSGVLPISFTVDQAQGVGDRGWNDASTFSDLFGGDKPEEELRTNITAVFRSSPQIRDFCHSILASGATLFTNFDNTLVGAHSVFTSEDERRAQPVKFLEYANDQSMISSAFRVADELKGLTESAPSDVLITTLSDELLAALTKYAGENNKPVTLLERRGDFVRIKQAEQSGHLVLAHADFVGGLEFNVVVIVGVDKGRVPHEGETMDSNSRNYCAYTAHNRLYVASSRAKYALSLLGVATRGASDLVKVAAQNDLVDGVKGVK